MRFVLLLLVACGGAGPLAPLAPPEAEVVMRTVDKAVGEGEPVQIEVEAIAADEWTVEVGQPAAEGLSAALIRTEGPTRVGERELTRWHYELSGESGSYVVVLGPSAANGPGDQVREFSPPPVFVDIGVKGPTGGPMAGFEGPPEDTGWPWTVWAAILGVVLLLAALAGWIIWRLVKRLNRPPDVVPDPPHVIALREWASARQAREDGELDDAGLALELSRVLRAYLEAICAWPATARTTREILAFLEREGAGSRQIDVTDRMRTSRILDATDRLKFAREGGGDAFFDSLAQDFQAVIVATQPNAQAGGADA